MRPDIPWNVAGIPPEAREAARTAARREGLSVGEWMTRRILRSFSDGSDDTAPAREAWPANGASFVTASEAPAASSRRDTEDMLAHVARSESESGEVFRRIEEQLRGVARRLEAAERNQSENSRAMSKAASEINMAAREQAQAFDQLGNSVVGLADRIDRVERLGAHDSLKDAVKGLHQGLTRVADQISATANQSAAQISALADNLEAVAGRAGQARADAEAASLAFEQRIAQIDERVRGAERLAKSSQETIQQALTSLEARNDDAAAVLRRNAENTTAIARLQDNFARLEAHRADPALDRRLSSIERSLSEIAGRFDKPQGTPVEDDLKRLAQRIEAAEARQHDSVAELRAAMNKTPGRTGAAEAAPQPVTGDIRKAPLPPPVHVEFEAPPYPERAVPDNAPPFQSSAVAFSSPDIVAPSRAPTVPEAGFEPVIGNAGIAYEPMNATVTEPAPDVTADTFLSSARRSARVASAQAEAERGIHPGAFSWGTGSGSIPAEDKRDTKRTYLWIGVIAVLAIVAVVAGAILSQRLTSASPHPLGSLFARGGTSVAGPAVPRPVPHASTAEAASASPPEMSTVVVPVGPSGTAGGPTGAETAPMAATSVTTPSPAARVAPGTTSPAPAHAASVAPPPQAAAGTHPVVTASLSPLDKLTALANGGNAKAELVVGLKYLDGDGVAVNEVDAAKWLARAADQGQSVAQYRLGTMFDRGRGVAQDSAKAVHWYTLAAQAGNRKAMHNLAVAYASGTGIAKNLAEAARWFSKAAALGLSDSQFNLAVLYERGLGVPQSLLDAYKWYAIAAATGDAESKARTEALATQLSAAARTAAQRSAAAFHAQPLDVKANVAPLMSEVTG